MGIDQTDGIYFDNIFASNEGYVARQIKNNDPQRLVLTWRFRFDGVSHISIPLSSSSINWSGSTVSFFEGYEYASEFFKRCRDDSFDRGVIVDLNILYSLMHGMVLQHEKLVDRFGPPYPYQMKIVARGIWRRIPFIDAKGYLDFIARYGIPVVQTDHASWPPNLNTMELEERGERSAPDWTLMKSAFAFLGACRAFGIPDDQIYSNYDWLGELNGLWARTRRVQNNRDSLKE